MFDPKQQQQERRTLNSYRRALVRRVKLLGLKLRHLKGEKFICPLCNYHGPFLNVARWAGERRFAQCPNCGSMERHRIQWLIMLKLAERFDFSKMSMLHAAPEHCLSRLFQKRFGSYTTMDLDTPGVHVHADLTHLPFYDTQFDVVFASHVLEHISEDMKALSEIRRILRPGGFAVLPVPIVADKTVEYGKPNPREARHVRSPGADYYNRYDAFFSKIEKYSSYNFPQVHQPYIYYTKVVRQSARDTAAGVMTENKLVDIVPVCFV